MPWAIHVVQFNIPDYPCCHDHIDFGRMRVERTLFYFVEPNCLSPNPLPINTHLSGYLNSNCHTEKHTDKHLLYAFFWVIPRRLNFICRRFGTLCLFHLHRRIGIESTPIRLWRWNRQSVPKRRHIKFRCHGITQKSIQHSEHSKRLKSRKTLIVLYIWHGAWCQV